MDKRLFPKVLAVYLPQFHETEDNSRWWGKGFTDWETVKKAEPCFEGHLAPWKPKDENYYDLSKMEALKWQEKLLKKYAVDGFCFYHYYFKNGKKELEKPAEILLENKDIDIPFCFNWASESWIRSWSKISGNIWSEKFETTCADEDGGVLVAQDYGGKQEWLKHFEYLLPFFRDERYICIDGKPVFIFYQPDDIKCLKDMVSVWRKTALDAGLKGLYLIGVNTNALPLELDASLIYEPRTAINRMNGQGLAFCKEGVRCFDYQEAWNAVLKDNVYEGAKTYFTGISGYDDTPRRGKSGECLVNNTPEIFEKNLEKLLIKSIQNNNEILLINAWNEWGEGMYLEPDELYGYQYLEALRTAKERVAGLDDIVLQQECVDLGKLDDEKKHLLYDVQKYKTFVEYYDKWLYLERRKQFKICEYLNKMQVWSVAVYGLGILGKQLYEQLHDSTVRLCYGIDRYVGRYGENFPIYRPESDDWPDADAIIVTAYDEDEIERFIRNKTDIMILKLSKIIECLWRS